MLSVTDFVPKGIISGVSSLYSYLDMLDADRSLNAVRVHAGTSQVDFEVDCRPHAYAASTRRSFDHHGKGNGNFVQIFIEHCFFVVDSVDIALLVGRTRPLCTRSFSNSGSREMTHLFLIID